MKRLAIILILMGIGINLYSQSDTIIFSAIGGFYENSFDLTLSANNPENRIFYTINGNIPTPQSYQYTQPLHLDENLYSRSDIYKIQMSNVPPYIPDNIQRIIVIRAAVFDSNDSIISDIITNSYCISSLGFDNHGLPVVSICADTIDLFDNEIGILIPGMLYDPAMPDWSGNYYCHGISWERKCNVEYYMHDNAESLNQMAGLRTHGHISRAFQQKGLSLYAREEYGKKRFKCRIFDYSPINKFKRLVLKPISCSRTDAGIEDYICNMIAKQVNVESPNTRPCTLYLNGEYWGIYYIQEKTDERFLENHFNSEPEEYNIVEGWAGELVSGTSENFVQMMMWLNDADIAETENYEQLSEAIDIECIIDYFIIEIFISNYDWPANNMRCWQEGNGPWRWIFFDGDYALENPYYDFFAHITDTSDAIWPTNKKTTLMFRKLITNRTFCQNFSDRFHELYETVFQYDNTSVYKQQIVNEIRLEMHNQINRFNYPSNYPSWTTALSNIDTFLRRRPTKVIDDLEHFIPMSIMLNTVDSEIKCFPNPTADFINISISNTQWGLCRIDIFDLQGRAVYSDIVFCDEGENNFTIDLQNFPQGTYIVKVGERTQKVVKIQ
jgi:hypothetical protein